MCMGHVFMCMGHVIDAIYRLPCRAWHVTCMPFYMGRVIHVTCVMPLRRVLQLYCVSAVCYATHIQLLHHAYPRVIPHISTCYATHIHLLCHTYTLVMPRISTCYAMHIHIYTGEMTADELRKMTGHAVLSLSTNHVTNMNYDGVMSYAWTLTRHCLLLRWFCI